MTDQAGTDRPGPTAARPGPVAGAGDEQGYAVVLQVVGDDVVAGALADLSRLRATLRFGADAHLVAAPSTWDGWPLLADDARLVALAEDALGGEVTCFAVTYMVKPARTGLPARWHQDAGPWRDRLAGAPAIGVWVALSPATAASGCLEVLPASHRLPTHPLHPDLTGRSMFGVGVADDLVGGLLADAAAVEVPVAAGDAVVLHPNLLHASGPNRSPVDRVAAAVRFVRRGSTTPV